MTASTLSFYLLVLCALLLRQQQVVYSFSVTRSITVTAVRSRYYASSYADSQTDTVEEKGSIKQVPKGIGITYSSSSGAAVALEDVAISVGNHDILNDLNWEIMPRERWGIVGRNGAGKSTLLKTILFGSMGNIAIQSGSINIAKKCRIGYLEQKGVSGSTSTLREEVASRMERLTTATKRYEQAEAALSAGDTSEEALVEFEQASEEFEAAGGYTVEQKIGNVLKGLGFVEEDYAKKCSEFSGGWQMRIALARLLLSEPDLLILDEPTNHLDRGARNWLGNFLSTYDSTLIVVSHDESLLEAAVSSIAEVKAGKLDLYKSRTHAQWLIEREERVKVAEAMAEANQREIDRLQGFVDRFGAKTMGASLAQSKLKTIEKLKSSTPDVPVEEDGPVAVLKLPPAPRGTKHLLTLQDVKLSWNGDKAKGQSFIIKDCNVRLERGMRVVVRGPNGAGKSTFLSALSGKLTPAEGARIEGDGLALGTFTQDLAQDLDQSARAVDVVTSKVRAYDSSISDEKARNVLGALGLRGEKALRKVGHLSGGEKARVALASFVLVPHNLLLLDEPSNHLDISTLDVLTDALREFPGSIVVISHDRHFLEKLSPTHVITVRGGIVDMQERELRESDWDDPLFSRASESSCKESSPQIGSSKSEPVVDAETKKARSNAVKKIQKIENSIEKFNSEMLKIDEKMYDAGRDAGKLKELQKEKDKINSRIDSLYAELEILLETA